MKKTVNRFLRLQMIAALILCAALFTASGCASKSTGNTADAVPEAAAAVSDSADFSGSGFTQTAVSDTESTSANPVSDISVSASERKLIRTVNIDAETDQFDDLITSVTDRITSLGGYTEQSDISGQRTNRSNEPIPRHAYIVARIPADMLDTFMDAVEQGANVTNKTESTQDVTLQYSDVESRKKSLTIEQERIWDLLEKADSLESILSLEERLSDIRYELESLESQLRLYDNQVDYSTVTLNISEVTSFTPTAPETIGQRIKKGFSENLESVSRFAVSLFILFISASPIWIPVLVIAILILLVFRKKRWKKRMIEKASGTSAEIPEEQKE